MESQFSQLRFDISEKIILQPQQPGIKTLLELDLYPDVEIRDGSEYLKIEGYLRLNGSYQGEYTELEYSSREDIHLNTRELSYVIPVEITLPTERAELERISAEVQTFDYTVISPFELQVEAVLVIDGILPKQEEISSSQPAMVSNEWEQRHEELSEQIDPGLKLGEDQHKDPLEKNDISFYRPESYTDFLNLENEVEYQSEDHEHKLLYDVLPIQEDEKEEKVFFVEKEILDDLEYPSDSYKMKNENDKKTGWINWLVGNKEEKFVSIRMVIAQNGESIENISDKYEVSTKQLMHINRLDTNQLEEGQIIHVPHKMRDKIS